MKRQHLNYCRQVTKDFARQTEIPGLDEVLRTRMQHAIDLAAASQKFLLPAGGKLIDDPDLRGIDESMPLRLPYPFIALEYETSKDRLEWAAHNAADPSERVGAWLVFAREREDGIAVSVVARYVSDGAWFPFPETVIPTTGFVERGPNGAKIASYSTVQSQGLAGAAYRVACLLNALACSNVRAEESRPPKQPAKAKAALPFDSYYILTIDGPDGGGLAGGGTHRSPREHLRRGHIRRYESGLKVWVNAHVVAAGRGAGKITKDYRLAA